MTPIEIQGYILGKELDRGGMSIVYEATRDGQRFAIKWMLERPSADALDTLLRFRREAAALARLDHEALVRVFEVGDHAGRPFLVMELLEGENVGRALERGPLPEGDVVMLGCIVASALAEVHRLGMVHRDVKPGNLVRSPSGGVKLIDFGLVSGAGDSEAVVGTLSYAAPEQLGVIKRPVGPGADLYALGATLFQCLAGRPPIVGEDESNFLRKLATEVPPTLDVVRPGTGRALAAIVARLLAKDPDDRYQTARGLEADLRALDQLEQDAGHGTLVLGSADGPGLSEQEIPLLGRDPELSRLTTFLDLARAGAVAIVQVEGEDGSGRSHLLREFGVRARSQGAFVLSGRCQRGDSVPFGALRQAVDEHVAAILRLPEAEQGVAINELRAAAGAYAPLVRRLSSGLAGVLGEMADLRALDPDAEQQRYYEAIATFFRFFGRSGRPLVLLIDDVQWLDEGSLNVLGRITTRAANLLLVGSVRAGGQGVRTSLAEALPERTVETVRLPPLPREAVAAFVTARLGGRPLEESLIERFTAMTNGNPFAIGQYLRVLLDDGLIRPVAGRWVADPGALDRMSLSGDLLGLMVGRLGRLSPLAARVAAVAGVVGLRFDAGLIPKAAGLGAPEVGQAIDQLIRADLVSPQGGAEFAFVHERVREAAAAALGEAELRDVHQAIAEELDGRGGTGRLYAIARHYALGNVAKNPERACQRTLDAGLLAVDEHANEVAFGLLDRARELAVPAGMWDQVAMRLLEGLGRACALTGRLDDAFVHLQAALALAESSHDRFRLQNLLTLSYASQGRNDDALTSLYEAFRVLGKPFPSNIVVQIITMLWAAILGNILALTGIGWGSARGEERERRATLSQLHYTGSMIALFQGKPVLMGQFIVRDFLNVHYLGATGDAAITNSVYGAVLGLAGLTRLVDHYCGKGIRMAEGLGDAAALSVCRAYHGVGTKWGGDLVKGNEMLVEALPALDRHVPGSWYQAMMITEQAYSYLHAGQTTAAVEHIRSNVRQLERTNNLMFRYNTMSVLYAELMVSGGVGEAQALWTGLEADFKPLSKTVYVGLARCIASLEVLADSEDTGAEVDAQIAGFQQLLSEDYYSNAARVLACYARMNQLQFARPEDRKAARGRFEREVFGLSLRAMVPVFQCNALLFKAVLARLDKKFDRAIRLLTKADRLATRCASHRAAFYIALERARIAVERGDSISGYHANQALETAQTQRWRLKIRRVRAEFGIKEARSGPTMHSRTMAGSALPAGLDQGRRYADALLQVSLASGTTLDPDVQAQNALGELTKVLGAERAMFFLLSDAGELVLKASTGTGTERISQTIVRRVIAGRAPVVLTGNEDGETLGSDSIVAYGLRSIMAAPLMVRDRLIGVVYLDSRLAKGMFTEDDVNLLLGVSNHIAIAVQTSRAARVEAERAALARDLEILGVVQNLLLPKSPVFAAPGLRGAAFYQAAAQCGGDWWWHHTRDDGCTLVVLGDVSGHGAGPAMLTSAVAATWHVVSGLFPDLGPPELLVHLHDRVKTFSGYHMTMSVALFDPRGRTLSWWNAAGPEIYLLHEGKTTVLTAAGTTLGTADTFSAGCVTVPLALGDRILLCTDGVLELRRDGRMLGNRQTSKMLKEFGDGPIGESCTAFGAALNGMLVNQQQDDDITFVMLEVTDEGLPASGPLGTN